MATYPYDRPGYDQWTEQPTGPEPTREEPPVPAGPATQPAIDVVDNGTELWVYADLAGFQPDEIRVSGDGTTLRIGAERPGDVEEGRTVVVRERPTTTERTVQLPTQVDVSEADMRYEHGTCQIVLPKVESQRFTTIEFDSD
jgi:HSP20 family protein